MFKLLKKENNKNKNYLKKKKIHEELNKINPTWLNIWLCALKKCEAYWYLRTTL